MRASAGARAYVWSSYRYHAYGALDGVVTPHEKYLALAESDANHRRSYRRWFREEQTEEELTTIRGSSEDTA